MKLSGSCHCRAVAFACESHHPYPYMPCYCKVCRKTAGGGSSAVTISAEAATLSVTESALISVYEAASVNADPPKPPNRRHFCTRCGSALWIANPAWPETIYPFAAAIDTPLPAPPERSHIWLESKPDWVPVPEGGEDRHHSRLPRESVAMWHERLGLTDA